MQNTDSSDSQRLRFFFSLIIVGLLILLAGFVFVYFGSLPQQTSQSTGAAVIIIGPVPLVFGSGPDVQFLLPWAIVLTLAAIAFFTLGIRRR